MTNCSRSPSGKHVFMPSGYCEFCSSYDYDSIKNDKSMPFQELAKVIGQTVADKNKAYGDSFAKSGEIIRILYPDGIIPKQYDDALAIIRIVDKLFRIATDKDAFGESPFRDIAGYGILGAVRKEKHD